jgi:hypothetical protein
MAFGSHFVAECVAKAAALARQSVVEADTLGGDAKLSARIGTLCQWARLVIQGFWQALCGRVCCQSSGVSRQSVVEAEALQVEMPSMVQGFLVGHRVCASG